MKIWLIILIIFLVCFLVMLVIISNAPELIEDDDGNLIEKKDPDDSKTHQN